MSEEIKVQLARLESLCNLFLEEEPMAEDLHEQIVWIEAMEFEIRHMYEFCGKDFQLKEEDSRKKLNDAFDHFIDELTICQGWMVQNIFKARNKFREHLKNEDQSSIFPDIKEGLEESVESEKNNEVFAQSISLLRDFLRSGGYDIKIVKKECESDEPKA